MPATTTDRPLPQPTHRWLILIHQLPPNASSLRVRMWRRLQQLGAIAVKHAVYVLPDSAGAREDFEWLKAEIEGAGGEASVFAADHVDAWSGDALVEEFRRSSEKTYAGLADEIQKVLRRRNGRRVKTRGRAPDARRRLDHFRQRASAAGSVDYFGATGREKVVALLDELEASLSPRVTPSAGKRPVGGNAAKGYRKRLWVTRPRPGVDRMSSAWLIRRFIDADARFDFVPDREHTPAGALPFDMFGVEFTHQGSGCTFEVLCERFEIRDTAVSQLAGIVHDLDLKDGRFGAAGADTVGMVIEGLQLAHADDHALLAHGIVLFEALYRSFDRARRGTERTGATRRRDRRLLKSRRARP